MSSPPPYDSNQPVNPDRRPLPPGWIEQYDKNYKTWFYVDTTKSPPQSHWVHPAGPPPPQSPPAAYAPPSGPPPPENRGYPQGPGPYGPQGGQYPPQQGWGPGPQQGWGGGGSWQQQPAWGGPQQGWQQGPPGQGYYPQQQPQVVYVEKDKKDKHKKDKHGGGGGMGMGTALAAGGVGLLGGVLIGEAIESHDDYEYDQGFQDGFDAGDGF